MIVWSGGNLAGMIMEGIKQLDETLIYSNGYQVLGIDEMNEMVIFQKDTENFHGGRERNQ